MYVGQTRQGLPYLWLVLCWLFHSVEPEGGGPRISGIDFPRILAAVLGVERAGHYQ